MTIFTIGDMKYIEDYLLFNYFLEWIDAIEIYFFDFNSHVVL